MYQYILFDLDGTLTDPKEGITKSVQYALQSFGIEEQNLDRLEPFIGPPLRDSFREFYGIDGEDTEKAVAKFRERFETTGIRENHIYPGIHELLHELKEKGCMLAIASSKPQEFVHIVLKNFDIEDCFTVIIGSEKDGTRDTKEEVLQEALSKLRKKAGRRYKESMTLMVGDRKFDVEAAHEFGVDSVAVTYGYAPEGELENCRPTYMADSVTKLREIITGERNYQRYKDKKAFLKTFEILLPLLVYWVVQLIVYNGLYVLIGRGLPELFAQKQQLSVWLNAFAAIASWPVLLRFYQSSREEDTSHVITRRKKKNLKKDAMLVIAYAVALGMGLNIIVAHFRVAELSESYAQVAGNQYSVPLLIGLVVYGLLTPFTEEILFRGIIYNRISRYFPVPIAIVVSAIVFGCYHGNVIQMAYAMIMGLALAFLYEYYDRFLAAPVLFHSGANLMVYLMTKGNVFGERGPVLYGVVLVAVAAGISCWYITCYQKKMRRR